MLDYGMQGSLIHSMKVLTKWKSTICIKSLWDIERNNYANVENLEEIVDSILNIFVAKAKESFGKPRKSNRKSLNNNENKAVPERFNSDYKNSRRDFHTTKYQYR